MHVKKYTQKDRHGNMMSFEFEIPQMNIPAMESIPHPGGPKGTDTVPAWLTPGEFVVNKEATQMYGNVIEDMNDQGREIQAMQGMEVPEYAQAGKQIPGPYDWITPNIIDAVKQTESGGRHTDVNGNLIKSSAGALGAYQWKPSSAAQPGFGVEPFDVTDEAAQRKATEQYLIGIQKENPNFTQEQVIQSYNAGPERMKQYVANMNVPDQISGQKPLTKETQEYDDKILKAAGLKEWGVIPRYVSTNSNNTLGPVPELDGVIPPPEKASNIMPELTDVDPGNPMFQSKNKPTIKPGMKDSYMNQGLEGEDATGPDLGDNTGQGDSAFNYQDPMAKYKDGSKDVFATGNDRDKARKYQEYTHKANNIKKKLALIDPVESAAEYNSLSQQLLQMEKNASKFTESAAVVQEIEKQDNAQKTILKNNTEIKVLENNKKNVTDISVLANIDKKIADLKVDSINKEKDTTYKIKEEDYNDDDFQMITKSSVPEVKVKENITEKDNKVVQSEKKKSEVLTAIINDANKTNDTKVKDHTEDNTKNAITGAGNQGKQNVKKAESFLSELFGDLIDKKELGRMAVMYAGSRLLGGSHMGSLGWAAKNYINRIDAKAANINKTAATLLSKGKHTTASIAAYKKSGNMGDLILIGTPINSTGEDKYFFHPKLKKKVLAYKYKQGDNIFWSVDGGKSKIPTTWTTDGMSVRGSKDYQSYVTKTVPMLTGILKDDKNQYDKDKVTRSSDGKVTKTTYRTAINITNAASAASKWAADNNIPADELGPIVSRAYRMAVNQAGGENKTKPTSLLPYLNALKIRADTGVPGLFTQGTGAEIKNMDAAKVNDLTNMWLSKAGRAGQSVNDGNNRDQANIFWRKASLIWADKLRKDPKLIERYQSRADDDETPFYVFAKEQLSLPI